MTQPTVYEQAITIPVIYNVPRVIAGHHLRLTDSGRGLYFDNKQICGLLDISEKTLRNHINAEIAEHEAIPHNGGGVGRPPHYLIAAVVCVMSPRSADNVGAGGGGGTQNLKLRHIELVIRVAMRMSNNAQKKAIIDEMVDMYQQYIHKGFVVNEYAVDNDQEVAVAFHQRKIAFNYSSERYAMLELNKKSVLPSRSVARPLVHSGSGCASGLWIIAAPARRLS